MSIETGRPQFANEENPLTLLQETAYKVPQSSLQGIIEGGLNTNYIIKGDFPGGPEKIVLRVPRSSSERERTRNSIQKEYDAIGATENGVSFRLRGISEQAELTADLHQAGYKVRPYLFSTTEYMVSEFIEGSPLNEYLQQDTLGVNNIIVSDIVGNLQRIHRDGYVMGDRWVTNTIVVNDNDFVEIDFDIALEGEHSILSTFELSQTLYHIVHFAKDREKITDLLFDIFSDPQSLHDYDRDLLSRLLIGQTHFFWDTYSSQNKLYEGLVPPLIEGLALADFFQPKTSSYDAVV